MEWVLVTTVDSAEEAESEVMYLRSRNIQGRVTAAGDHFAVQVRKNELENVQALLAARASLRTGSPPRRNRWWMQQLRSSGVRILVGAVLLVVAFPALVLTFGSVGSGFGVMGPVLIILLVVALPAFAYHRRKVPPGFVEGDEMLSPVDHERRNSTSWRKRRHSEQLPRDQAP